MEHIPEDRLADIYGADEPAEADTRTEKAISAMQKE